MIAIWPSRARESPPSRARNRCQRSYSAQNGDTTWHSISRLCSASLLFSPAAIAVSEFRQREHLVSKKPDALSVLENVERQGVAKQSTFFRQWISRTKVFCQIDTLNSHVLVLPRKFIDGQKSFTVRDSTSNCCVGALSIFQNWKKEQMEGELN